MFVAIRNYDVAAFEGILPVVAEEVIRSLDVAVLAHNMNVQH